MGQALYRKYRSRSLKDVVGQEHVTKTLQNAVEQGKISHAYLFTGPRGVGKTSVARILAHQVNGLDYSDDSSHIDIIEIDAASNRRIDEIRDLRDKVYVAPASAKYKVYIIDEVHMLTREAFNALLKTLEEPPAHVVFILATTDAHKLPETIISRTQRFSFKPASEADLVKLLKKISSAEKIDIDDAALSLVASHGGGSFRDSVSLLDQLASHGGKVAATNVESMLGLPSRESLNELYRLVFGSADAPEIMRHLAGMYAAGNPAAVIAQQLGEMVRKHLLDGRASTDALDLLESLIEVPASHNPERSLEIALLRQAAPGAPPYTATPAVPQHDEVTLAVKTVVAADEAKAPAEPQQRPKAEPAGRPKAAGAAQLDAALWPEVLKSLKQKHNTLYGVVRMGEPDFSQAGKLRLAFAFSFHQKRLSEAANRQKLADILDALTGRTIDIECVVDKSAKPPQISPIKAEKEAAAHPKETEKPQKNEELTTISNIFGNAELLES